MAKRRLAFARATMQVWRHNEVDLEETLDDDSFIYSWTLCKWTADPEDLPARYVHDNIPSRQMVARHLSMCMDLAFDQEPFFAFFEKIRARL